MLIAQNQLLRAQEGVAKIQAERLGAHASLVTALGGGLDDPANGPQANETLPAHGKGKGNGDAAARLETLGAVPPERRRQPREPAQAAGGNAAPAAQ